MKPGPQFEEPEPCETYPLCEECGMADYELEAGVCPECWAECEEVFG